MLTCAHCFYTTNRTYNLNRHITTKHSSASNVPLQDTSKDTNSYQFTNIDNQFINIDNQNINMSYQNINMDNQNINIEEQNINIEKSIEEEEKRLWQFIHS